LHTHDLRHAYDEFLNAARHHPFAPPSAGSWSAELVLAHVIVSDRLIAQAAGRVMAGMPSSFDNLASQSEPYLQTIVDAAGDWNGLVATLEHTAAEVIALAERLTDEQAATPITTKVVSDGAVVIDRTVPVAGLLQVIADAHLRMHMRQLSDLSPTPDGAVLEHASSA
jgi:hypothetical protein